MAKTEIVKLDIDQTPLREIKKTTLGTGLLKGLQITMRHLLSRSVTVQYPDEKDVLPARSRGVIALKEENCTVCMLCAKECPDWCIYIDGHKEFRQPAQEGKRAKKYNVLDRFAIDYALCMYCGICVEVCPYDALFWTPEYEYAEHDITHLTHEMDRLSDWMYTVLPPDELDPAATGPEFKTLPQRTAPAVATPPASDGEQPTPAGEVAAPKTDQGEPTDPAAVPEQEAKVTEEAAEAIDTDVATGEAAPQEEAPQPKEEAPTPSEPQAEATAVSEEEAEEIGRKVYEEEIGKGSDPRVAEGRRKAAVLRARKGTRGPGG
ncbi:MAG: 4Fe-4S binding protein [Actinobacteria bacterium]|nr:4Fe-4S binding protein [Actinomycetota bacterium]